MSELIVSIVFVLKENLGLQCILNKGCCIGCLISIFLIKHRLSIKETILQQDMDRIDEVRSEYERDEDKDS